MKRCLLCKYHKNINSYEIITFDPKGAENVHFAKMDATGGPAAVRTHSHTDRGHDLQADPVLAQEIRSPFGDAALSPPHSNNQEVEPVA